MNNQLIRAFLQLKIIARNFSAFISILSAPAKKDYVLAIYQLPNKIFNQWSESIDNSIDGLVEEIILGKKIRALKEKTITRGYFALFPRYFFGYVTEFVLFGFFLWCK